MLLLPLLLPSTLSEFACSDTGGGGVGGDGPVDKAGLFEGGAAAAAERYCYGKPGVRCGAGGSGGSQESGTNIQAFFFQSREEQQGRRGVANLQAWTLPIVTAVTADSM